MNRILGLASALVVAASCSAASAQQQVVPAVGTIVRFQERNARSGQRPSWEVVSIVLPQPREGAVSVPTPLGDSPENRARYCAEHTTTVPLPNDQQMHVNCFTYTQALILDYTEWLKTRGLASVRQN